MKNYSSITENKDILTKEYADSTYAKLNDIPTSVNGLGGGTLTSPLTLTGGDATTASKIILTDNGQITDQSTSTLFGRSSGNLIVGHQSIPLRLRGKATNPVYSNDNKTFKELAFKSDIPAAVTESTVSGWGFTKNTGTVTSVAVKMNDETKGKVTSSGTIDLGTVITAHQDISGKANLSGGNTFSGNQVITGYLDIRGTAAEKHLKTRGIGGSDGNGNSSDLYLQYSSSYKTYFGTSAQSSLNSDGSISINGKTAATTNQIPTFTLSGTTLTITI